MRIIKTEEQLNRFLNILRKRAEGVNPEIISTVSKILKDVQKRGDKAVREYTKRFDRLKTNHLKLSRSTIKRYAYRCDKELKDAIALAAQRIRDFHSRQLECSWKYRKDGMTLGQIVTPLERIGVYVPGGKASYPSTVLMNVIPAQVAGVKEIALCVPIPDGEVNPAVMAAIDYLDIKEVYTIGGAQAVAAFAYGTESIKRVDKIVGPGNIYVAIAKKMVFGTVDIDMIAGPSEILIISDTKAEPDLIAADMLSQAEHDEFASSVVITTSETQAKRIEQAVNDLLKTLNRSRIASLSLKNYGAIIITKTLKRAAEIANRIAPEHLEIMTEKPEELLPMIKNAGAVFLGKWTPEPLGDYIAGPNHTLPTGGSARFFSPLGVYDFMKRTSLIRSSKTAFKKLSQEVITLAEAEGLEAHANTIKIRLDRL